MSPLPDFVIVTDDNGTPDFAVAPSELVDAGASLAAVLAGAHGDEETINAALLGVLHEWDDSAEYVLLAALKALAADLLPLIRAPHAPWEADQ